MSDRSVGTAEEQDCLAAHPIDPALEAAIKDLAMPDVLIGHRLIMPGDESALFPEEAKAYANCVLKVKRASGAARIVARELLSSFGFGSAPLVKSAGGAPLWPPGITGSLAHDRRVAVAAVARSDKYHVLGIDVEPAEDLSFDLMDLIATPGERMQIENDTGRLGLLFCIKEAVYKALNPIDGVFLEHHDVEVDLSSCKACVRHQREVDFRYFVSSHFVALAFLTVR